MLKRFSSTPLDGAKSKKQGTRDRGQIDERPKTQDPRPKTFFLFPGLVSCVLCLVSTGLVCSNSPTAARALDDRPLLPLEMTGVVATNNRTLDITLPTGLTLSGIVRDDDGMMFDRGTVIATSEEGDAFTGEISPDGSYRIVLPSGRHTVSVQRILTPSAEVELRITRVVVDMVNVTSDRTLDLTVPSPPQMVPVSGDVTSQGVLPTRGVLDFDSVDDPDQPIEATVSFDGSYRVELPRAGYEIIARLQVSQLEGLTERLSLRMEAADITGPRTLNLTLPRMVTLSGVVRHTDGRPAVPVAVTAVDLQSLSSSFEPLTFGFIIVPETSATGAYRLVIPPSVYIVTTNVFLTLAGTEGQVNFPVQSQTQPISRDRTQDFTLPPLPSVVTISGIVRDAQGQPVAGARVAALSRTLTNTRNTAFIGRTETDSEGRYTLSLLSGTDYTLTVTPDRSGS